MEFVSAVCVLVASVRRAGNASLAKHATQYAALSYVIPPLPSHVFSFPIKLKAQILIIKKKEHRRAPLGAVCVFDCICSLGYLPLHN